MLADNLK